MFYFKNRLMKLEKVAYNMDYTAYLDIYFMLDTAKVVSSSLALMQLQRVLSRPLYIGRTSMRSMEDQMDVIIEGLYNPGPEVIKLFYAHFS